MRFGNAWKEGCSLDVRLRPKQRIVVAQSRIIFEGHASISSRLGYIVHVGREDEVFATVDDGANFSFVATGNSCI